MAAPVTALLCVVSAVVSLGFLNANANTWEASAHWGAFPANEIWAGKYWGLLSATLVHSGFFHLFFNLYWLWRFGSRLEPLLGRMRQLKFLGLLLLSAFVSSDFQLLVSGATGIGLSGVVYAIFGFAWASRRAMPELATTVDKTTVQIMVGWLFLGVALNWIPSSTQVGNGAHFSGCALGLLAGIAFAAPSATWRNLARAGVGLLTTVAVVSLFWAPWSPTWRNIKAYEAAQRPH